MQGHVLASLDALIRVLDRLCSVDSRITETYSRPAIGDARQILERLADETLGAGVEPGVIRIMVTMPSEAAVQPGIIEHLLHEGTTVMRVNCAHDGPEAWAAMIRHLELAKAKLGKECLVAFDLAGPKLRTGPVERGPEVLRFKPVRDKLGFTVAPATILFGPAIIPVEPSLHDLAADCR